MARDQEKIKNEWNPLGKIGCISTALPTAIGGLIIVKPAYGFSVLLLSVTFLSVWRVLE